MSFAVDPRSNLREQLLRAAERQRLESIVLPPAALELLKLSTRANVTAQRMLYMLQTDAALAASTLKLAASRLYATRFTIESLQDAFSRLGPRTMVDVVFEAAVSKDTWGVRENARTFRHLRKHSVVTAHVTRILCRHARIDTDHAFLTGLLHDLGMFALLQAAPQVAREQLASEDALWPEIDALHEGLSSTLAARLLLPDELTQDIANHHSLTNNTSRTSAAVSLADHLSQRLGANLPGFGRSALDCMTQDNVDIACSILALDDIHLNRVCIEAERVIAQITTL